jgi:hypothetical protein
MPTTILPEKELRNALMFFGLAPRRAFRGSTRYRATVWRQRPVSTSADRLLDMASSGQPEPGFHGSGLTDFVKV